MDPVPPDQATPTEAENHPLTRGYRARLQIIHAAIALLAVVGGAVTGFMVTLAIVVAQAQFGTYIFGLEDLVAFRWEVLPVPLGAFFGYRLGRRRPHSVAWATSVGFASFLAGVVLGALIGGWGWGSGVGNWAGAVIGGAILLVAGTVLSLRISRVPRHPLIVGTAGALGFIGLFLFAVFGATNLLDLDPVTFPELSGVPIPKPAEVDAVVFLVGDAGAAEAGKSPLLAALKADVERWSAALGRDSAVTVTFLGDNVYPQGVHDRDDPGFPADSARLRSQVDLVSGTEAARRATIGLFVPGNHDWGNTTGDEGFRRVLNQEWQLDSAREAGAKVALLPSGGDPGPVYRDLRRNVRIVFFDTHWFLQERSRDSHDQFFTRLRQTIDGARDREVVLVAHHPYYSAGPHGAIIPGYHTLGVAYVLKQAGALVQDLNSPPYDALLAGLRRTFDESRKPPLIYAGGHDHSLQVLTGAGEFDPRFVLVSGAGSKMSSIRMGPGLVWGASKPGYMMLVFRRDDAVDLFVVAGDEKYQQCTGSDDAVRTCVTEGAGSFVTVYSASLLGPSKQPRDLAPVIPDTVNPGTPWWVDEEGERVSAARTSPAIGGDAPTVAVTNTFALDNVDSFTVTAGRAYPAGRIRRFFAGDLNRHLWGIPVRLPVLDLGRAGGGLHPQKITGGQQTVGLRLLGRDGLEYEFRPIVKNPAGVLPRWMREGAIADLLDDQMAAQFPFGAVVVARLQQAAGIDAPRPVPVVMPNDARLGEFRPLFAGRVGLFSMHAEERSGKRPGFGGHAEISSSEDMYKDLLQNPESGFDDRYFLRIRLLDLVVGDWDRHSGQWRWARVGNRWRAIPEDRDWAFARMDGVLAKLSSMFLPRYVGFSDEFPPIRRLAEQATTIDHHVLNRLTREDFVATARELQAALSDSVIAAAVRSLPESYLTSEQDPLVRALTARRDALAEYAGDYYAYVMQELWVFGIAGTSDVVEFDRVSRAGARILVRTGGPAGAVRFERFVSAEETDEVVLHIDEARDSVVGGDGLPFKLSRKPETPEDKEGS